MADGSFDFSHLTPKGGWRPAAKIGSVTAAPSPFSGPPDGRRTIAALADISAWEPDIDGLGLRLVELQPGQCRWPMLRGDGAETRFCGLPTQSGARWCPRCAPYGFPGFREAQVGPR